MRISFLNFLRGVRDSGITIEIFPDVWKISLEAPPAILICSHGLISISNIIYNIAMGFLSSTFFKDFLSYCFSNSCSDSLRNSCRDRFRKPSRTLSGTTPAIPSRITPEISSGIFQGFHFKFRSSFASYYEKLGLSPFNKFITFLYISITHGFS